LSLVGVEFVQAVDLAILGLLKVEKFSSFILLERLALHFELLESPLELIRIVLLAIDFLDCMFVFIPELLILVTFFDDFLL
jgi:hypothetical protein